MPTLEIDGRKVTVEDGLTVIQAADRLGVEVTKTSELGIFERGDHSRIELAHGKTLDNPYSMNVVDICPVGALTSRDFRFRARVWYLERENTVCGACANGCNIEMYHREG